MSEKRLHKTNKEIAITMAICSLIVVALLILKHFHVFDFAGLLGTLIPVVGFTVTLSPLLLFLLKAPDHFLKYYSLISMSILIGTLGCFHNIGIYISFILVPITSCLYLDTKLTVFSSVFSYLVMVVAVFFNSADKLEVEYLGWTHMETFRAYLIGFTMEYAAATLFISLVMKKFRSFSEEKHRTYLLQQAQDAKYQLLVKGTKDLIFEYYPNEGKYVANRSIHQQAGESNSAIVLDNLDDYLDSYPGLREFIDRLVETFNRKEYSEFEIDMSYEEKGETIPLWFNVECFIVQDGEQAVSVIGKMHDITRIMVERVNVRRQQFKRMAVNSGRKNSIFEQVQAASRDFTEADYGKLAAGHRFLAMMMEDVKYSANLVEGIHSMLESVGKFFHVDRICVIETDVASGTNTMDYQWNSKPENQLVNWFTEISREELRAINVVYEEEGYLELNPTNHVFPNIDLKEDERSRVVDDAMLGNQLWIPMMSNGKYIGAVYIDRYDTTLYTPVEKLLLSEAVNSLVAHILKINAENANRAKSDFLSTMSHEIRTPMNAIVGMTEVALREDMNESVKKNLKMVKSSAFGLLTLINDILDYSKIEAGRFEIVPEKFSILSIMNDVKEISNARNKGKLELVFRVPPNLPMTLYGDSVRIKQVMINYCTNAIKYSDQGKVEIRVMVLQQEEGKGLLKFAVKDNGIGIKKEDLPKLFKSYTRVDTTVNHHKEGTGLGLAICKQLVELMGGMVSVESEYGKGSTFSFEIPLDIVDATPAGRFEEYQYEAVEEEQEAVPVIAPTAKVLIVDDTNINLLVAKALMGPTKIQVDTVDSGEEALNRIQKETYDLVFMDHFMPGMDGVETTQHIREFEDETKRNVPIIALTADAMDGVREALISKGMNDFLTKPIIVKNLYQMLRNWIPKEKIEE